ncbi:hypothetical protein BDR26DRAFT_921922, partial [Obelidium mucronatum]
MRQREVERIHSVNNMSINDLVKLPKASVHENCSFIVKQAQHHLKASLDLFELLNIHTTIIQDDFKTIQINTSGAAARELVQIYKKIQGFDLETRAIQARAAVADRIALGHAVSKRQEPLPLALPGKKHWIRRRLTAAINKHFQTNYKQLPMKLLRSGHLILSDLPPGFKSSSLDLSCMQAKAV